MNWFMGFKLKVVVTGAICCGVSGCQPSGTGIETFPTSGKVRLASGQVPHNATLVFHPVNGDAQSPRPRAVVAADGSFSLTTFAQNDGAPAGEYRVTVEWWQAGRGDDGPANRLPPKYSQPAQSGLRATIASQSNQLPELVLKK